MQFQPTLYRLVNTTNMHVGSGKNNYGIIDNLIQRDVVTSFPTINASSLKGALREYCDASGVASKANIIHIFGSDPNSDNNSNAPGKYRFFPAQLLSVPVRTNLLPYVNVTCKKVIEEFQANLKNFGLGDKYPALTEWLKTHTGEATHYEANLDNNLKVEITDLDAKKGSFGQMAVIKELFGEHPVLVSNERFKELTNDNHLPVISRNYLENGVSKNLWYEQVLPRQSRFYFIVLVPDKDAYSTDFSQDIAGNQLVQIGGNASIGYGFSQISKLT